MGGAQISPDQTGLATHEADVCVAGAVQPDFPYDDSELLDDDISSDPANSTPQRGE